MIQPMARYDSVGWRCCCTCVSVPYSSSVSSRKSHGHFSAEGLPPCYQSAGKQGLSKLSVEGGGKVGKSPHVDGGAKGSRSPQPQRPTHLLTPTSTFPRSSSIKSASASPSCATSPQTSPGSSASTAKRFYLLFIIAFIA
jgi:hypothetical protein